MKIPPHLRLFVVDGNNMAHTGIATTLTTLDTLSIINIYCYEQLQAAMAMRELAPVSQDIVLLGESLASQHARIDIFTLLEKLANWQLPVICLGRLQYGWLLHYLLEQKLMRGYLHLQDDLDAQLLESVLTVGAGKVYLSASAERLVRTEAPVIFGPDEVNVLRLLSQGHTAGEIAARLRLSRRRVYGITERLRELFRAATLEAAMVEACHCGLLTAW